MKKKSALIILDGLGLGSENPSISAVAKANIPFLDKLFQNYPNAKLLTSGENVGLPDGQMGNSEVGHMNIGAGRIVYQQLVLINKAFREGTLKHNPTLKDAFEYAKKENKNIH